MRRTPVRWAAVVLLALVVPRDSVGQDRGLLVAREAVGRYQRLEHVVRGDTGTEYLPSGERVPLAPLPRGFALYRVEPGRSHASPFLVGWMDGRIYRLGGFDEVELTAATEAAGLRVVTPAEALDAARLLAMLADPHGAESVTSASMMQEAKALPSGVARWRDSVTATPGWLADTVLASGSGIGVRITVLSRGRGWGGHYWTPIQYAFWFDRDGQLAAWLARRSDPLNAPEAF
jgi:hypothetical protein